MHIPFSHTLVVYSKVRTHTNDPANLVSRNMRTFWERFGNLLAYGKETPALLAYGKDTPPFLGISLEFLLSEIERESSNEKE